MKKFDSGNKPINIGIALSLVGILVFSLMMAPSKEGMDDSTRAQILKILNDSKKK
jgi:hypothetical protein